MLAHVEQLLSITNLERGELQLSKSNFMLGEVLDNSIRQLMAEAELGDHVINQIAPPDVDLLINGDKGYLRQILLHVLSHAVSRAPSGTNIDVSVRNEDGATMINVDFASLSGIAETCNALQDPFETTADPLFANDEGLGIALYIARLLAEAHGGTVLAHALGDRVARLSAVLPAYRVSALHRDASHA